MKPERIPAPLQVPVADLVSGDAKLFFDGQTVTVLRGPISGKTVRRAQDAALGAYPSGSAHPSGDRKRAKDVDPGETTEDDEEVDPMVAYTKDVCALAKAGVDSEEALEALRKKHFGEAEDVGGNEGTGGPEPFAGKPNTGGTMTKSATDKALTMAIDALPKGDPVRKVLKRQRAAMRAGGMAQDDVRSKEMALDEFLSASPRAMGIKLAMDKLPEGSAARRILAERAAEVRGEDIGMLADITRRHQQRARS